MGIQTHWECDCYLLSWRVTWIFFILIFRVMYGSGQFDSGFDIFFLQFVMYFIEKLSLLHFFIVLSLHSSLYTVMY